MSILDKHPSPWRQSEPLPEDNGRPQLLFDGNDDPVVGVYHCEQPLWIADEGTKRLILAAPELLAALKEMVDHGENMRLRLKAEALIERIEKDT